MYLDDFWRATHCAQALRIVVEIVIGVLLILWALGAFAQVPQGAVKYRLEYPRVVRSAWGLDAPVASLAGQLAQESGWRDGLVSRTGAKGLAQFMPTTATWLGSIHPELAADALYSPAWSMRAQATYMRWLYGRVTAANACERWGFALAGYNGGEKWVKRRQALSQKPGYCFGATCRINPGIAAESQRENVEYPKRIEFHWAPRFVTWGIRAC